MFVQANASILHQVCAGKPFGGRQNDLQYHQYENIAVNDRHMLKPEARNSCGQTDRITPSVIAALEQRIQSHLLPIPDHEIEIVYAKPTKKLKGTIAPIPVTTSMNKIESGQQGSCLRRNERMDNDATVVENELYDRSYVMT